MNLSILQTIESLETSSIKTYRKEILEKLGNSIAKKLKSQEAVNLNFICTHNSRRSLLSQVWMQTLSHYYGFNSIHCYSGGTEATEIYKSTVESFANLGFNTQKLSSGNNPVYSIKFDNNVPAVIGFSKTFSDSFNPKDDFIAIMTCSEAETECPYVPNANLQIPITFEDPKAFDNTPQEKEKYRERSLQIATEFKFVLEHVKSLL